MTRREARGEGSAIHDRHHHVQEHETGFRRPPQTVNRILAVRERLNPVSFLLQESMKGFPNSSIIFNNKYFLAFHAR